MTMHRQGVHAFLVAVLALLLCGRAVAHAQAPALEGKNVLVLHAFESNVPINEKIDRGLMSAFESGGLGIRQQFFEYLDLGRNPGPVHRAQLVELLRLRYAGRPVDLIVTVYAEALRFVLEEGGTIFPDAPVLALWMVPGVEPPKTGRRVIQHFPARDAAGTVELALTLMPGVRRLYVVAGVHEADREAESRARREFARWDGRLEIRSLSRMPFDQILATVAAAPPETAVIVLPFTTDVSGRIYTVREVSRRISAVSAAPVFGLYDMMLGEGIVGGSLLSYERIGARAGALGLDILRGLTTPEDLSAVMAVPPVPMFDWRQLKRWKMNVNALPPQSVVVNRQFTVWEQYRAYIVAGALLLGAQALLIVGLLAQGRRRRAAENTLRESEQRLKLAVDGAGLGVWSWDVARSTVHLGLPLGRMVSVTPGIDLPYADFLAFVHEEDRDRLARAARETAESGKDYELEYRVVQPGGAVRWISSRGSRIHDEAGARIIGVSQDITERKRSELAVRESERRFRRLADAAPMMVWTSGLDGGRLYCNKSWLELTGRTMEQESGWGWMQGIHAEDQAAWSAAYSPAFTMRKPFETEYRLRRFDGEYRWILDVGTPIYEDDGHFVGFVGSCLDITERKRAEQERQLLASVVESSRDAISSLTVDGMFTSWNPGAEALFGYTAEEVKGQHVSLIVPAEFQEETRRALATVRSGASMSFETTRRRKDGSLVPVSITAGPIRGAAGEVTGLAAMFRDLTAQRQADLEAARLRAELAHTARVVMLGQLTTSIAHEVNQPLAAIVSNAHAGERYLDCPKPPLAEVRDILSDMAFDARRAGEVIHRMRAMLKKDVSSFLPVDLNRVVEEVIVLTRTDALIRNVTLRVELEPGLPSVRGDRVQLEQVVLNLILNGMEAIGVRAAGKRVVMLRTIGDSGRISVAVRDEGPGIPADDIEKIFESFYTTKPSGMGMGLAISRAIVEAHGGRIWAENNPDRGATFWFTLPADREAPASTDPS